MLMFDSNMKLYIFSVIRYENTKKCERIPSTILVPMTASRLSVWWFLHMKRSARVSECRALTCALRNVSSLASFQSDVTTCFACTALNSTHTINTVVNNRKEITQNLRFITRYFQFNIVDKLWPTSLRNQTNEHSRWESWVQDTSVEAVRVTASPERRVKTSCKLSCQQLSS